MSDAADPGVRWVVYLLHFESPTLGSAHYVGITTPPRLPARMREHAAGRGSRATATACALGLSWKLARTWPTQFRALEARMRDHPGLDALCPVCQGQPGLTDYRPTKNAATREWPRFARSLREALSFGGDAVTSGHEKREGTAALPLFPTIRQP